VQHTDRKNPFVNREPLVAGGRSTFMQRVRTALGRERGEKVIPPAPPAHDDAVIRQVRAGDPGIVDRWATYATGNGMKVARVKLAEPATIQNAIDGFFADHKITRVILNAREFEAKLPLVMHLSAKGIETHKWGDHDCSNTAFTCEASITDARAGLADTGSLLVWSDKTFGRATTLVTPVHVVLLPASRILPDLIDGLALVAQENNITAPGGMPSNVVVINGPSKTADIEMNLVTGVHGPKYLYILLLDDA